mgnify:CR=1 FL=1
MVGGGVRRRSGWRRREWTADVSGLGCYWIRYSQQRRGNERVSRASWRARSKTRPSQHAAPARGPIWPSSLVEMPEIEPKTRTRMRVTKGEQLKPAAAGGERRATSGDAPPPSTHFPSCYFYHANHATNGMWNQPGERRGLKTVSYAPATRRRTASLHEPLPSGYPGAFACGAGQETVAFASGCAEQFAIAKCSKNGVTTDAQRRAARRPRLGTSAGTGLRLTRRPNILPACCNTWQGYNLAFWLSGSASAVPSHPRQQLPTASDVWSRSGRMTAACAHLAATPWRDEGKAFDGRSVHDLVQAACVSNTCVG